MPSRYVNLIVQLKANSPIADWGRGDVIFDHLCRMYADLHGAATVRAMARLYQEGEPWCVVSDPRPVGYLPRPCMPSEQFSSSKRWQGKKKGGKYVAWQNFKHSIWVPTSATTLPVNEWRDLCVQTALIEITCTADRQALTLAQPESNVRAYPERRLGIAPFKFTDIPASIPLELSIIVDTQQVSVQQMEECVLLLGRGRRQADDHNLFHVINFTTQPPQLLGNHNSLLTLAPSAPQGSPLDAEWSWYKCTVHFDTQGLDFVGHVGKSRKTPVVLALAGAVFTPKLAPADTNGPWNRPFFGRPIGGAELSNDCPELIHQGFAPFVPVDIEASSPGD